MSAYNMYQLDFFIVMLLDNDLVAFIKYNTGICLHCQPFSLASFNVRYFDFELSFECVNVSLWFFLNVKIAAVWCDSRAVAHRLEDTGFLFRSGLDV